VARPTLVVTVHDLAWRHHPDATTPRGRRWHEASLGRALRHADALVVPSHPVANDLLEAGAVPERVTVIDEGADHLPPADGPGATALLRARGVAGGYLLTVGTLQPRKNLARLVAAYEAVRPSLPEPWPLVVVGATGWGAATPSNERAGRSWRDVFATAGVVAVGAVPDEVLAGLYAGARAFAYVPLAEGFGLPPLEAMTFGVPVVASSAVPSIQQAAPDAPPTALVVDPLDVDAIAGALATVSTDDELRRALTTAGTADVGYRTWARAAAAHVGLWRALRAGPTR